MSDLVLSSFLDVIILYFGYQIEKRSPLEFLFPSWSVWPDWVIYWTLGNFLKLMAKIILPKLPTLLGNFWKGVKIYHFSCEIIFGQLFRHLAIFLVTLVLIHKRVGFELNSLGCKPDLTSIFSSSGTSTKVRPTSRRPTWSLTSRIRRPDLMEFPRPTK